MKLIFRTEVELTHLTVTEYADGNLAVRANLVWPDGEKQDELISINLAHGQVLESKDLQQGEFFANINESYKQIVEGLISGGWIETTGSNSPSGHLVYPSVRLTGKAVLQHEKF